MPLPIVLILLLQAEPPSDDAWIAGYASAILERDFDARGKVEVRQGVLTLSEDTLQDKDRDKVIAALSRIKGVRQVVILPGGANPSAPSPSTGGGWSFLPEERLFEPLLADPRWPHFGLTYDHYHRSGIPKLIHVAAISLGEQFNVIGFDGGSAGKFDLGLQPAVFGIFNLDASSLDLINADYRMGVPLDYRNRWFSAEALVYHQSSHLGDEFLLGTPITRVNLSYEAFLVRVSAEWNAFRAYLGAQRIFHTEPGLEPWSAQQGIEFVSPTAFFNDSVRPIVAVDVREQQENGWSPNLSVRAGVELSSPERGRRRVQLLLEYYRGFNPNGQFYRERIETLGFGLHVYF
jgi:uncharacterized protein DUF1207